MKISYAQNFLVAILILLFAATSVFYFLDLDTNPVPPGQDLDAMRWLRENTPENATVLGRVREGFLISYVAERRNVADANFLYIKNAEQRYSDVISLYKLKIESEALRLIQYYRVDYILVSMYTQQTVPGQGLYYEDPSCFDLVYDKGARIYKSKGCMIG